MSFILLKSILAIIFLVSAVIAVSSMLTMMGKTEKKISPKTLRTIHKISGRIFLILLIPLIYLGMKYWARIGDQASARAVFHAVLALGLIIIFLLKISIVKMFKQFLRFVPVFGMLVFSFAFVVFSISAGFYSVKTWMAEPESPAEIATSSAEIVGSVEKGEEFYNARCLSCHNADSEDKKLGPGLKDLLKKESLPQSGRPATVENVKQQLIRPTVSMPSFANMTEQEMADLIAYLQTL
jgi:cytochrome c2